MLMITKIPGPHITTAGPLGRAKDMASEWVVREELSFETSTQIEVQGRGGVSKVEL